MSDNNTSQPTSILFFIAVAIGVVIALIFIFFSLRYYIRTKMGIYSTARMTSVTDSGVVLLSNDFTIHTFNAYNTDWHEMRRRRRRRYQKRRRLTEQEVDHLFPARSYQDWLDGGAERDANTRDIHKQLKEENREIIEEVDEEEIPATEVGSSAANVATNDDTIVESSGQEPKEEEEEVDLGVPTGEIHFDSGTCAICIEAFEKEDIVRGLICGHVFHQECLDPWLTKRKACCPMCKRDYYLKSNHNAADGEPSMDPEQADDESAMMPELQYTTLADRVSEILQNHPELEAVAKENITHYLRPKWRPFWIVMGISRIDLINSAIVAEAQRRRSQDPNFDSVRSSNSNNNEEQNRGAVENMV